MSRGPRRLQFRSKLLGGVSIREIWEVVEGLALIDSSQPFDLEMHCWRWDRRKVEERPDSFHSLVGMDSRIELSWG